LRTLNTMQLLFFLITLALTILGSNPNIADFTAVPAALFPPKTAHLSIPAIRVEAEVIPVELKAFPGGIVTWDVAQIDWEVGYLEGTAWFGEGSNTVLGGHSELEDRQPAIFQSLHFLDIGDIVTITTSRGQWHFVVDHVTTVPIDDLSPLYPTEEAQLTLITCDPQSYAEVGEDVRYDRRVVVTARLINDLVSDK
jgi:LPXTG-site transpeptidase (sortase) family protein